MPASKTRAQYLMEEAAATKEVAKAEKTLEKYRKAGVKDLDEYVKSLADAKEAANEANKATIQYGLSAKGTAQENRKAQDDYNLSLGKKAADAAKKGGKVQQSVFKSISGDVAALTVELEKANEAGDEDKAASLTKILGLQEKIQSSSSLSGDEAATLSAEMDGIDMDGLGDSAQNIVGSMQKNVKFQGMIGKGMEFFNIKAISVGAALAFAAEQMSEMFDNAQELTKELGISASQARNMAFSWDSVGASIFGLSEELKNSRMAAEDVFDSVSAAADSGLVREMTYLNQQLGVSAADSAELANTFMNLGGLSRQAAVEMQGSVGALAEMNDVAPGQILADMAQNSEMLAKFSDGTAEGMARAAIQAKKMGIELSKVGKVMDGLLDLESSITGEMEASVLIGRDINLDRARQLALNNDIEGAMNAVIDQLGSEEEFNKMNAIQRSALADSIGVGVEDLANMVNRSGAVEGEGLPKYSSVAEKGILKALLSMNGILGKLFGWFSVSISAWGGWKIMGKWGGKMVDKLGGLLPKSLTTAIKAPFKVLNSMFGKIVAAFKAPFKGLSGIFGKMVEKLGGLLPKSMGAAVKAPFKVLSSMFGKIGKFFAPMSKALGFIGKIFSKVSALLAPLLDMFQFFGGSDDESKGAGGAGMVGGAIGAAIGSIIPGVGTAIGYAVGSIMGRIINHFFPQVGKAILSTAKWIKDGFIKAVSSIGNFLANGWDLAKNVGGKIKDFGKAVIDKVMDAFQFIYIDLPMKVFNKVKETVVHLMDKIIDAFKFMYIDLPMRVYNTLKSVVGYVADKVVSVFSGMVTAVIGAIKAGINQGINLVNKVIPVDSWKLPLLGDGGVVKQAGAGIVGEKGAEMVNLPSGASVSPNKSLEILK